MWVSRKLSTNFPKPYRLARKICVNRFSRYIAFWQPKAHLLDICVFKKIKTKAHVESKKLWLQKAGISLREKSRLSLQTFASWRLSVLWNVVMTNNFCTSSNLVFHIRVTNFWSQAWFWNFRFSNVCENHFEKVCTEQFVVKQNNRYWL